MANESAQHVSVPMSHERTMRLPWARPNCKRKYIGYSTRNVITMPATTFFQRSTGGGSSPSSLIPPFAM